MVAAECISKLAKAQPEFLLAENAGGIDSEKEQEALHEDVVSILKCVLIAVCCMTIYILLFSEVVGGGDKEV